MALLKTDKSRRCACGSFGHRGSVPKRRRTISEGAETYHEPGPSMAPCGDIRTGFFHPFFRTSPHHFEFNRLVTMAIRDQCCLKISRPKGCPGSSPAPAPVRSHDTSIIRRFKTASNVLVRQGIGKCRRHLTPTRYTKTEAMRCACLSPRGMTSTSAASGVSPRSPCEYCRYVVNISGDGDPEIR